MTTVLSSKPGGSGGGGAPSGPAGGDLSGTYPNPDIAAGAVDTPELAADAVDSTIIDGADAAGIRTLLDVPSNSEALLDAIFDAKGDILAATAADTASRLAVGGTDGMTLQVAAAQATGLQWALPIVFATYVPALTAVTTNPTLGTGSSVDGQYAIIGKLAIVWAKIVFGSSGVNAGSGTYSVSLPVNFDGTFDDVARSYGVATLFDSGTTRNLAGVRGAAGSASTVLLQPHGTNVSVSDASPWTWAANDSLELVFAYKTV